MRKLLSIVLAITMVLSTVVFAAPSAVTLFDAAEEMAEVEDMALSAENKLSRGINFMTGTKDAFDGDNYTDTSWLSDNGYTNISVVDDPTGVRGKVLQLEFPAQNGEKVTEYPNSRVNFNGDLDTDIGHTYVYLAFDYQKYVPNTEGYIQSKAFWLLNSLSSSGDFAVVNFDMAENEGWVHYGKVIDYSVNNSGYEIDSDANPYYKNHDINVNMQIQFNINKDNTVPVYALFDNFVFAPAYKVTYYNAAGTKVLKEEYVVVDEEGNLLSSFKPSTLLDGDYVYGGWSETIGGAALTEVALTENEDIVLYATLEKEASDGASIVLDKKLTNIGVTATATANIPGNPEIDASLVTWTSDNTSVASVSYDKDKGVATVTARAKGTAKLTFSYSGFEFSETITVADGPVVENNFTTNGENAFKGLDLDVYEYITLNVTNSSDKDASLVFEYCPEDDSNDDIGMGGVYTEYEIIVPAGSKNRDVFADMSEMALWKGRNNVVRLVSKDSSVTINNAKLWALLNTENGIEFTANKNLITEAGDSATVVVYCSSDLEGVYAEDYTITVEADDAATYSVNGNKVTVTAVAGSGSAIIKAVSNEDSSVKAEKEILIRIVEGKGVAYKWDFNNASNTGFEVNQRYKGTEFNGSTANVRAAWAVLPGTDEVVPVELSKGTVDGKSVTVVKKTTYGTMSTTTVPSPKFSALEYPYLVFKARTNTPKAHKFGLYLGYSDTQYAEDATKVNPEFNLTTEWDLYVVDVTSSAAYAEQIAGKAQTFRGMMFSTNCDTVVSSEIKKSGSTYYIEGEVEYNPDYNIEIDEIYFANYDPNKIYYGVSLKADKTSLDSDGIITLTSEVFGSDTVVNDSVNYTVDKDGYVSILKNSDGTATVTPLRDGTVTITATSVLDETAYDTVTLTFSNIPTKTVAYDLKLMLIGNSYLEHAPNKDYVCWLPMGEPARGMAASAPGLDYYGRLVHYLTEGFSGTFTAKKQGGAVIEQAWKQGLASGTPTNLVGWDKEKSLKAMKNQWESILDYMDREQPNLITIQLAENAAHAYEESAEFFYDEVFKAIDEHRPENSIVVIISPMGSGPSSRVQPRLAAKYGFYWADNTYIFDTYGNNKNNPYLAFHQYPEYDEYVEYIQKTEGRTPAEFRSHPGDLGMDYIAKTAYAIFEKYIPTTIPATLVTVPETIDVSGVNSITSKGGVAKLSVAVTPTGAAPEVYWSVDNENLATVDEDGLVTALLNGTVTVTAVSAYDDRVVDTHTIEISGQTQHYTLTYAAGTADEVENIPAPNEYAAGTYTFPSFDVVPERNGYKFIGWSETKGASVVDSIEMTGAKTVYAVWAFADNWQFEKDGDFENVTVAGYNAAVKDGALSMISYGGTLVGVSDSTLLIPAGMYKTLKFSIAMSTVNDGDKLNVTINSAAGQTSYSLDAVAGGLNEYLVDISDAEGTITGFNIETSNGDDGVGMTVDYIEFVKSDITADTELDSYNVVADTTLEANGNKVTVNTLTISENATLTLGAGTYVIGNIEGEGEIKASANANVIVLGENKPAGYIELDIGANAGDVRYAEVNGSQNAIYENGSKYGVITSKNLLIEIVGESSKYYYVNASAGTYEELDLTDYMKNDDDNKSLRVPGAGLNKIGLRFAAYVMTANKKNTEVYEITEYGYIIALKETLEANGEELNHNASKYVSGVAYRKG